MIAPTRDALADWLAPSRSALVIVDMQIDFAAPHGALALSGADLSAVPPALAAAERLLVSARDTGVEVVFVGLRSSPETDSPAWSERERRLGGNGSAAICRAGEPGVAFHGPQPSPGETIVFKTRYSAFFGTDLDAVLKARGIDTLVVCGLTTECCVDGAVRDAFQLDYHVFVVADACAAYRPGLHAAALEALALNCAIIVRTDDVAGAWRSKASGAGPT